MYLHRNLELLEQSVALIQLNNTNQFETTSKVIIIWFSKDYFFSIFPSLITNKVIFSCIRKLEVLEIVLHVSLQWVFR